MSYKIGTYRPSMMGLGAYGLGDTQAQRTARRLNAEQDVDDVTVGPGLTDPNLDAALEVRGISTEAARRVPAAVREALEASGQEVKKVCWGGGDGCGGEATRGKVYVKWQPDRDYNAVTYADIARNLFMNAAEGFAAGSRIVMHRYRIMYADLWAPFRSDKFVYPTGGPIPAGAPEAARRTTADAVPLEEPPADVIINQFEAEVSKVPAIAWVGLGVGGAVLLSGAGLYTYYRTKGSPRRNRRRRRRTSR